MSKTIKVIDLLNMIAKGEKLPEKIKYNNQTYILYKKSIYVWEYSFLHNDFSNRFMCVANQNILNEELEIIEEQPEIDIQSIEEVPLLEIYGLADFDEDRNAINQLIRAVKQLDNQINNK